MEYKPRYLVMVTASANNNKYYKQIPHGDSWTAEYGRVGSSPGVDKENLLENIKKTAGIELCSSQSSIPVSV